MYLHVLFKRIYICLCVYISGTIKLTLHLLDLRCVFLAHLSKNIKKCKAARATKKTATASSSLRCIFAFLVKKPRKKSQLEPMDTNKKDGEDSGRHRGYGICWFIVDMMQRMPCEDKIGNQSIRHLMRLGSSHQPEGRGNDFWKNTTWSSLSFLVGGWTNPFEKYYCSQLGNHFPR